MPRFNGAALHCMLPQGSGRNGWWNVSSLVNWQKRLLFPSIFVEFCCELFYTGLEIHHTQWHEKNPWCWRFQSSSFIHWNDAKRLIILMPIVSFFDVSSKCFAKLSFANLMFPKIPPFTPQNKHNSNKSRKKWTNSTTFHPCFFTVLTSLKMPCFTASLWSHGLEQSLIGTWNKIPVAGPNLGWILLGIGSTPPPDASDTGCSKWSFWWVFPL